MEKMIENIDRVAKYDLDNNKVFGCCYYVYHNGKTIEKCYGPKTLNSNQPITNTTVFRLASMTKPYYFGGNFNSYRKGFTIARR